MGMIEYAFAGKLNRFYKSIKNKALQENRNPQLMFVDFVRCVIKYKCGLADYVNFEFYKKSDEQIRQYITIDVADKFYETVSPAKYKKTFTDKPTFMVRFKDYVKRDFIGPNSTRQQFDEFLSKNEYVFIKPTNGLGGSEVTRVKSSDIENRDELFEKILKNEYMLDEPVVQHPKMAALAPGSVNTIRIMSYRNKDHFEIFFAGCRMGNGQANVDNFHQGGIGILVDVNTGKMVGSAVNKEGLWYASHPTSGIEFEGFEIPNWQYIKQMVEEASLVEQNIHVVGWDVAVTQDGALFIEGNRRPGFDLVQELYKRGTKDITDRILADYLGKK